MNDEIYARQTRKIARSRRAYDCKYESTRVECGNVRVCRFGQTISRGLRGWGAFSIRADLTVCLRPIRVIREIRGSSSRSRTFGELGIKFPDNAVIHLCITSR